MEFLVFFCRHCDGNIPAHIVIHVSDRLRFKIHIKDISEGFDVLSLFGKKERFVSGISEGSDGIEKPKFRLNATKGVTYAVVNCANLVRERSSAL